MKQWKNLLQVAHVFFLTCSWEMLFSESKDTDVFKADSNKLFASNEKQIDSHTLMLVMLHSNRSVLCTYLYIGAFKKIFWCGFCSLLIFLAKKATKGTELQFLCIHFNVLHSPQLYIQAILYITCKTDYMISLTLYTLTSVCIFSILFSTIFLMC